MFQLGKTLISEAIITESFACNLSACKGACCIDGDAGAPLETDETQVLEAIYTKVKPFLRPEGRQAIEEQGVYTTSETGELETPLIDGADCAYVIFDATKTAHCAIEVAYNKGLITWKKPISCELYPIRVQDYTEFSAVNYHQWDICKTACSLGKTRQTPIYKFVKTALIRKFGAAWYAALEDEAARIKPFPT